MIKNNLQNQLSAQNIEYSEKLCSLCKVMEVVFNP